ncbi:ABC transporter substrate-binding protein [Pendulispora albinea]|uniref:ABC transporter substrate-binding protein n=1 Tax=Pendulispora albinea TaxID=2741071 RepID=A0ABZ2M918_9BACT
MRLFAKVLVASAPLAVACSVEFSPRECKVDSDCGTSLVCVPAGQAGNASLSQASCVSPDKAPLRIGISAPATGPNQDLGNQMSEGIQLAFKEQNDKGGVRGRQLELVFKDDGYVPASAQSNAGELLDVRAATSLPPRCPSTKDTPPTEPPVSTTRLERGPGSVLAILGNVGTPTMVRFAPIAVETETLFFGAFTGATLMLRDDLAGPCKRFIFNVRASYAQEARATLEYFLYPRCEGGGCHVTDYQHLISFDQKDTYGQAGYTGLVNAYKALSQQASRKLPQLPDDTAIPRFQYERNIIGAGRDAGRNAITHIQNNILKGNTATHYVGVLMTDTYSAGADFIKEIQDWRAQLPAEDAKRLIVFFSNVSFVGPNSLATLLASAGSRYTENVFVSQVVPNYAQDESAIVRDYQRMVPDASRRNYTSFEGYITAHVFVEGLLAQNGSYTADNLINTFENLRDVSLGLGAGSGFSPARGGQPADHNYTKSVWGTAIQPNGSFKNVYFWQEGIEIQVY